MPTYTKLPNGTLRIWPAAEDRTIVSCKHWTADPEHLGRGGCGLKLYGGAPVLGMCLLRCEQYTGSKEQRGAEADDMFTKYAQPGEFEIRKAIEQDKTAAATGDREAITTAKQALVDAGKMRSDYLARQPVDEARLAGFDPATERRGCCDPPLA
jgi:hypothetical protein